MIKRILFDLDNTLIPWEEEWDLSIPKTFDYFNIPYEDDIIQRFFEVMHNYERYHKRYNKIEMSKYFRNNINKEIPDIFVDVWTGYLSDLVPKDNSKIVDILEYLSSKYSLVVVTNWFKDQQVSKLKKFGILKYFDDVITADEYDKKPRNEMYEVACRGFNKDEVVMVGDSFKVDIKGAMDYGLYSYYYTKIDPRRGRKFKVIRDLSELKEYL